MIATIIGALELFSLGFAKAMLVGLNKYVSGLESLGLGGFAVGVGYLIGLAFKTNWPISKLTDFNCLYLYFKIKNKKASTRTKSNW